MENVNLCAGIWAEGSTGLNKNSYLNTLTRVTSISLVGSIICEDMRIFTVPCYFSAMQGNEWKMFPMLDWWRGGTS
jgi:hypothetical protein